MDRPVPSRRDNRPAGVGDPFSPHTDARVCRRDETPGPNDLMRCGTESAIFRHLAKREPCRYCHLRLDEPTRTLENRP